MQLYDTIKKQLKSLSLLSEPLPIKYKTTLELMWLGHLPDSPLFPVEIRESKNSKGWLYAESSLVYFTVKDELYECWLYKLRELAEEKLARKVFDLEPMVNCLIRDDSGRIIGWLSVEDVLEICKKIEQEGCGNR